MAHQARTATIPAQGPGAAPAGTGAIGRVDVVLEGLWHLLTSMRVAMILILALAALAVVGALVIQAPPGVLADPEAKASWLNEIRPKFGGWTGIMDQLQLFGIFNSLVFRLLVAAISVSLIACSVHRVPGMWRTAMRPHVDVGEAFFEHAPQHETVVVRRAPAETLSLLGGALRKHHYRVETQADGVVHVYADRFRFTPFLSLAGHLSLVVILAGAIVGSTFGYRDSQFTIAEGATLPVAAEPGLSIQLIDFADSYYPTTGAPADYASQVVLYKDGAEVGRQVIRVNDPLRYGDTTFYQAFFGSAAVMTIKDASGATLVSQGVPLAWRTSDGDRPVGSLSIPGTDDVAWVIGTGGTTDPLIQPGQVRVELYGAGSGAQLDAKVIDQGAPAAIGGLTVSFDREGQFAGLNVARDPGVPLVWLGGVLLFGGFVLVFFFPHRRIWARIAPRGGGSVLSIASLGRRDAALGSEFDSLVSDIRAALAASARH
jgi:cytochrome c biogenesis protein